MDFRALLLSGQASVNGMKGGSQSKPPTLLRKFNPTEQPNKMTILDNDPLPPTATHVVQETSKIQKVKKKEPETINEIVRELVDDTPGVKKMRKAFKKIAEIIEEEKDAEDLLF